MPDNLRKAHQALDRAVDKLYRRIGFASERERVEHLFMLYEKMRAPLNAAKAAIYVLHAFQKKAKQGIATPKQELDLVRRRLKAAQEHYADTYGER